MPKSNLPQFFEELKIKEDATLILQDLIANFKQQIPFNYLEIKLEEGNYLCSTNPKWKNKPLCERYFFTYEGKEIQLDIPHTLIDKLGLEKGADITQPLYLDPQVLERTETYKGITIEEGEIILVNPNKIVVKEQEMQTDLSSAKIKELENTIAEKTRQIQAKDQELADLRNQLSLWTTIFPNENANQVQTRINALQTNYNSLNSQITEKNTQISSLTSQVSSWQTNYNTAQNNYNNINNQIKTLQNELDKERVWWDKWINDSVDIVGSSGKPFLYAAESWSHSNTLIEFSIIFNNKNFSDKDAPGIGDGTTLFNFIMGSDYYDRFMYNNGNFRRKIIANCGSRIKESMKNIYQYYRDK